MRQGEWARPLMAASRRVDAIDPLAAHPEMPQFFAHQ
jgi:hypothetical protein